MTYLIHSPATQGNKIFLAEYHVTILTRGGIHLDRIVVGIGFPHETTKESSHKFEQVVDQLFSMPLTILTALPFAVTVIPCTWMEWL